MTCFAIDEDQALAAARSVLVPGDAFGELFAEHRTHAVYEISDGEPRTARIRHEEGTGLRGVGSAGVRHFHAPGSDPATVDRLAAIGRGESDASPPAPRPRATLGDDELLEALLQDAVDTAREAETEALKASDGAVDVTARVVVGWQQVLIVRSDGRRTAEERRYAALHMIAVARRERQVRKGRRSHGCQEIAELRADGRHLALGRAAAQSALERLDAVSAPSGEMPVVLAPGGPATLFHEACGHALEADLAQWPGSAYYGQLGQRVADPGVTVIDDPGFPADARLYDNDDEGERGRTTYLIEDGVLRAHLLDRRHSPTAQGTGNARRLSYAYPPLPRMSVTYLAPGHHDPAEIIQATPRGIYVVSIAGGDTDMGSGRFNLQVDEGYLIENGQLGPPIRGAMLSGRGPDILRQIDLVGTDLRPLSQTYLCNKLDQFPLVVNVGQPTVRIASLAVWAG